TGNEVLAAALAQMRAAGITGTIYTHPIGDRGHGAGPLIGLWDHQEGVPGRGDVSLLPNTWFSIELQATTPLPEWGGQPVRSAQVEAEVFTRAGFDDVTWAFPIDPSHIPHARRLAEATGATLRVTVDDESTARALAGSGLHVWLKVDSGLHRAGVDPASPYALRVAAELGQERGLVFDGILTHSGHAYRTTNKTAAARVAEQERSVMVGFAERVRTAGVPVREVSVGSTPAMAAAEDLAGVTEARPGNYVFFDRTMVLIGCCEPADVGVTVLATVVSHQPGAAHFIVNAGALELSKDPGPAHVASQAMGAVRGAPELT